MNADTSLNIGAAWNAVALEERLELISRSKAVGFTAAIGFMLLMGSIAYGFDQIWLLLSGFIGSFLIAPLFSSYTWRQGKPELILSYLAVRSMARRYAFGMNISDLEIVLIFRGHMKEIISEEEGLKLMQAGKATSTSLSEKGEIPVWFCLMRGGIIVISEQPGGAKLEFYTPVSAETVIRKATAEEEASADKLVIEGSGTARGRKMVMGSSYKAALYVFEKRVEELVSECLERIRYLENLRTKNPT